jgi:hypothetical protein
MDRNELNEKAKNAAWTAVMNCAAGDRLSTSEAHLLVKEAIRAYLSALLGEPVAWRATHQHRKEGWLLFNTMPDAGPEYIIEPLFTTPPASPALDVAIEALQRLASPEAFCLPRMSTAEEIARMEFADKALATLKATRETV